MRPANENYIGADGKWTRDNAVATCPCLAQEAIDAAERIRERVRGKWLNSLSPEERNDLGLAARVLDHYYDAYRVRKQKPAP